MDGFKLIIPATVFLVIVGLILSFSANVSEDISNDFANYEYNYEAYDTSWHPANSTTEHTLEYQTVDPTSIVVRNVTDNALLNSGNYTYTASTNTIILTSGSNFNGSDVNLTYNYGGIDSRAYESSGNLTKSLGNMSKYLPLIAVVIIASIIIGMVVFSFKKV